MPAFYPSYACQCCGNTHDLYYAGIGPTPELSKPWYFTCTKLPVPMRVVAGDRWRPMRKRPDGAIEIRLGDVEDG
jgi:hypothetical protein